MMIDMNKLPLAKRVQILAMLCEGSSMRSISRMADSYHGVKLDPEQLVAAAHAAGRPAAERSTLYRILRRYELPQAPAGVREDSPALA